jgi:hypothetical protein
MFEQPNTFEKPSSFSHPFSSYGTSFSSTHDTSPNSSGGSIWESVREPSSFSNPF